MRSGHDDDGLQDGAAFPGLDGIGKIGPSEFANELVERKTTGSVVFQQLRDKLFGIRTAFDNAADDPTPAHQE